MNPKRKQSPGERVDEPLISFDLLFWSLLILSGKLIVWVLYPWLLLQLVRCSP